MPRLSRLEEEALHEFASAVRNRYRARVVMIKLFGSRARGEGRSDSDLDIFVQLAGLRREEKRFLQDLGFDISFKYGLTVSPLVADARTWRGDLPIGVAISTEGLAL